MLDPSADSELTPKNSNGQALHKQLPKAKKLHEWTEDRTVIMEDTK